MHGSSATCCWKQKRSQKVSPERRCIHGSHMVQLAENRVLRVRHVNPRPRSTQLSYELQSIYKREHCTEKLRTNTCDNQGSGDQTPKRTKSAGPTRKGSGLTQLFLSPHSSPKTQNGTVNSAFNSGERIQTATSVVVDVNHYDSPLHAPRSEDIEEIPLTSNAGSITKHVDPHIKDMVIFMFHGVGGSADIWQAQVNYFANEGYEIVTPDLIGHGFSSSPKSSKSYYFKAIASDVLLIFDKYCKRKNVLIGHSYGCSFACYLARERSDLVSHLVLISGGSPTPLAPQPGIFQWPICCLECCKSTLHSRFKRSAFHESQPEILTKSAFDVPTYVLKYTMRGQVWPEGDFDYHALITAKTLIMHGEYDSLISFQDEEEMAEAIRGSELILIDNTSHMVMMEKPMAVNTLMHDFIIS